MKIAIFEAEGKKHVGKVVGGKIAPITVPLDMNEIISSWEIYKKEFCESDAKEFYSMRDVKLCAPVARPGKIFAIGLNYADHIEESKMETPTKQVWFTKAQTSINGPYDDVLIAKNGKYVDYEVELVAVIGKKAKNISAKDAHNYVFGYCVGNDVTERMWQHSGPQWSLGKSFDTHAPIGPWITTADEIENPHDLNLKCIVNGEVRQNSNTKHLVFDLWQQIEHLSQAMTLEPGDLIFTGTPGGVGAAMDPRKFLKAGDMVICEIDQLGKIENKLINE